MIISFLRIISRSIISAFPESEITHILKVFSLRVSFPIHSHQTQRWWTQRPGVLQSMRSPRVGHNWATEQQPSHPFPSNFYMQPG